MTDREPIVNAVLADPVVKAVLEDPISAPAVAEAISPGASAAISSPIGSTSGGQAGQTVIAQNKPDVMILPSGQPIAAPTTTEEEDRVSLGQRDINLIWENTQRRVALQVVGAALIVAVILAIFGRFLGSTEIQLASIVFLYGVANLVTGFYFGRTNHQKTGGVGQISGR
jgi:hypothetical protein